MPRLQLESTAAGGDVFNLDEVLHRGLGIQALSGVTGLGLPNVAVQWVEGAGDGATFRGRRVLPREIDLPLLFQGRNREHLKTLLSRFALLMAGECVMRLVEDDGTDWSTIVHRVGGGSYVYGQDTIGEDDLFTVVTLRAGDPYWTSSRAIRKSISRGNTKPGFLRHLARMPVSSSQAIGTITFENVGDAVAYPLWELRGPGRDFRAISPRGERLHWTGRLQPGERLVIDTRHGTVIDGQGRNRYAELAPAPRFWTVPTGTTTATASLEDAAVLRKPPSLGVGSLITCTWRPRRWLVI
ncbi:hypothetical protein GCM10010124_02290 [Pilimelia terevasa]|uniref:Phage tail protein n=1 Tax=Pilimelia terevasa TaxID=53372 RepID=A0A8J3BIC9_9ACTN|nr:phage tail domain-containing protein [Pilimelia terevasa]GGK13246.1 hypothetical protein GCM10010124_02290 [Pilimelia terevasa]